MAKSKRISKKKNKIKWTWRSFKNWFIKLFYKAKGKKPTVFHMYDNSYEYYSDSEICNEETEPVHEIIGYKLDMFEEDVMDDKMADEFKKAKSDPNYAKSKISYHTENHKRQLKLKKLDRKIRKALREGEDHENIICRASSRK